MDNIISHATPSTAWHHRPNHLFIPERTYMVTAATRHWRPLFAGRERLELLYNHLLDGLCRHGWDVEAWVVLPSHYHVIATAPRNGNRIREVVQELHMRTAKRINELDACPGRQVWFQYWDTCISFEASLYSRMRYVMMNPVKHGLVVDETDYPWGCSWWFARNMEPTLLRRIRSYRCDRLKVVDRFLDEGGP